MSLITACGPLGEGTRSGSAISDTHLSITVWPQGQGGASRNWTLLCGPVGGSLPGARNACSRLTREALRPLPRDSICTQVYGGPHKAHVVGAIEGVPVDARFSRTNGCEIHRWDGVRFLFPVRI